MSSSTEKANVEASVKTSSKNGSDRNITPETYYEVFEDVDKERYLDWEEAKQFLNSMKPYSKAQCYYLLLLWTGLRPIKTAQLTTMQLLFGDPNTPKVLSALGKPKTRYYYKANGQLAATKKTKVQTRVIPCWVRDYVIKYVESHWNMLTPAKPDGNKYLFPSMRGEGYVKNTSWGTDINKRRKKLFEKDPGKWAWVNEKVFPITTPKGIVYVKRLSQYSFRKSRVTWEAQKAQQARIDPLMAANKFLAHSKVDTTWRYIADMYKADGYGNFKPIKPPDFRRSMISPIRQASLDEYKDKTLMWHKTKKFIRTDTPMKNWT